MRRFSERLDSADSIKIVWDHALKRYLDNICQFIPTFAIINERFN